MVEAFHIFSTHRSGTKFFCNALDNHPLISCRHEGTIAKQQINLAVQIAELRDAKQIVGVHTHYPFITDEIRNSPYPKILLLLRDSEHGAMAEATLNTMRANGQFKLDSGLIREITKRRQAEEREMAKLADLVIYCEDLTHGENIVNLPREETDKLCNLLEIPLTTFTTNVKRELQKLPEGKATRIIPNEKTYENVITGTYQPFLGIASTSIAVPDDANIVSMVIDRQSFKGLPADQDVLYLRGYLSLDGGNTWRTIGHSTYRGGNVYNRRGFKYQFASGVALLKPGIGRLFKMEAATFQYAVEVNIDVDFMVRK